MHLPYQRRPLHDLPDTPEAYDTSLGVTSLLALAWQRGRDPRLPEAVRRSLAFPLRERVFRADNPGYPNLRIRDSGLPYARFVLRAGAHPHGDRPSTVWTLLQTVNVLDAADLVSTTALEAGPAPEAPADLHVFAVRYGDPTPFAPTFEPGPRGLTVDTEAFTALIGDAAGDAQGEPELTLERR